MGFSRQEYWNGLPFLSPGDLPDPGIKTASPVSLALQADSLSAEPSVKPQLCHCSQTNTQTSGSVSLPIHFTYTSRHWVGFGPQAVAHQAPLSMGFSRQEYWNGLPFLSPGDLPDPGIKPVSLMSPALASGLFATRTTLEALEQNGSLGFRER